MATADLLWPRCAFLRTDPDAWTDSSGPHHRGLVWPMGLRGGGSIHAPLQVTWIDASDKNSGTPPRKTHTHTPNKTSKNKHRIAQRCFAGWFLFKPKTGVTLPPPKKKGSGTAHTQMPVRRMPAGWLGSSWAAARLHRKLLRSLGFEPLQRPRRIRDLRTTCWARGPCSWRSVSRCQPKSDGAMNGPFSVWFKRARSSFTRFHSFNQEADDCQGTRWAPGKRDTFGG